MTQISWCVSGKNKVFVVNHLLGYLLFAVNKSTLAYSCREQIALLKSHSSRLIMPFYAFKQMSRWYTTRQPVLLTDLDNPTQACFYSRIFVITIVSFGTPFQLEEPFFYDPIYQGSELAWLGRKCKYYLCAMPCLHSKPALIWPLPLLVCQLLNLQSTTMLVDDE